MSINHNFKKLFIAISFGSFIGLIVMSFFKSLFWVQEFHSKNVYYIFLLPIVWLILRLTKKFTLYFPVSVAEVYNTTPSTYKQWPKLGLIFNFFGSVLSHFSGASIGREGVAITLSASLAQLLKIDWVFWRPIVISAGFGIAVDNPFVGLVFLFEVFISNLDQKILALIMCWVGCLVLQTAQLPHLLEPFFVLGVNSYTDKLVFILCSGAIIGMFSQFYKTLFFKLKSRFDRGSAWFLVPAIFISSVILFFPEFKDIHSLSLAQFQSVQAGQVSTEFLLYKIAFTLFFTSIGFWGGDFVPSVLIGSGIGVVLAKLFSMDPTFGLMLGSFSFFCGLTRLKWTAFFLTASLVGFHQLAWVYLFLTVCNWFSGTVSVYTTEPSAYGTFFKRFY